jgi:hypothetical protein
MSLPSATVWEVRPATGSDSNGGGFVAGASGTDYSQQTSAQHSGTAGTAAGTSAFSDAGYSFQAADVGNILNLASGSGFTVGMYEIVSVSAGIATLDRSPGTGTAAVWAFGGALASLKIIDFFNGYNGIQATTGNIIWMTGTLNRTVEYNSNGWDSQVFIYGYGSSRGDGTKATIAKGTGNFHLFNAYTNLSFKTIAFTDADGQGVAIIFPGVSVLIEDCSFDDFGAVVYQTGACQQISIVNTEIKNCSVSTLGAIHGVYYCVYMAGCYCHDNAGPVFKNENSRSVFIADDCVFYNNLYGFYNDNNGADLCFTATNCAFVSSTDDAINVNASSNASNLCLVNNIFSNNGGYAIKSSSSGYNYAMGRNNAFYNNTSGDRLNFPTLQGDISLTGSPFTNPSTADFSLNATSGAGAACKGAGFEVTP